MGVVRISPDGDNRVGKQTDTRQRMYATSGPPSPTTAEGDARLARFHGSAQDMLSWPGL